MTVARDSGSAVAQLDRDPDVEEPQAVSSTPVHVWIFLVALVFNLFSGTSELLHLPLSPDRPLFLIAVVLLLLDPATSRLRPRGNQLLMGATVLWTMWSWMSTGALTDTAKAFALADRIVMPFLMFLVAPLMFSDDRSRTLLLRTLALVGLYLGVTGIFEIAHIDALVFPRGILDASLGIQADRARGPFLASEPMGMAVLLIALTNTVLLSRTAGVWRYVAGVSTGLCSIVVVLCLTRSVWVAAVVVAVACTAAIPALRRAAPVFVIGLASLGVLMFSVSSSLGTMLSGRAGTSRSVYDRLLTNEAALRIIDAHPIFGIGWGRFIDVTSDWVRQDPTIPLTTTTIEVHNVFLSRAAETGLPGSVLWGLVMLTGPVAVVWHRQQGWPEAAQWRLVAGCSLVVWLLPSMLSPNPYPFPNNLIWLLCGIAGTTMLVRPTEEPPAAPEVAQRQRHRRRRR